MKRFVKVLLWLHRRALYLYPPGYLAENGEERQIVFRLVVQEAVLQGKFTVAKLVLRELRDLPGAIIHEHRREKSVPKMGMRTSAFLTFEPGSQREMMAALAPFLLFGAFSTFLGYLRLSNLIPHWLDVVIALSMLGLLLSLFGIGVIKGFPRWFLPYIGLPLPLFCAYIFLDLVSNPPYKIQIVSTAPWLLREFVYQGQIWLGLLVAGLFLVLTAWILPPLRPFYWRLRRDWTLLSFILYGAALFALVLTFDDYVNEEPYKIASMLLLAGGGWLYLRSAYSWQRFLALFTGLTLAMIVAAVGKAILYSSPNWPYPRHFTWYTESMGTVIMGGWLVVAIFSPALLLLLPRSEQSSQTE